MKRWMVIVLMAYGMGFAQPSWSQGDDGFLKKLFSPMHDHFVTRPLRYFGEGFSRDEMLVKLEFVIKWQADSDDPGEYFFEYDFLGSSANDPVKLVFETRASTVTFIRTLGDISSTSPGAFDRTMTYKSYDDLELSVPSGKKPHDRNVRVYFTSQFMFLEVSDDPSMHNHVRNALFFVGPPASVHEKHLVANHREWISYEKFKNYVQENCIKSIRAGRCRNFDPAHLDHLGP